MDKLHDELKRAKQEPDILILRVRKVLAMDATLLAHQKHWLVRETIGLLRRTFSRLDVSSRSLFALIEPGSCFAGTFLELALACDRSYHLALPDDESGAPKITVGELNFSLYPMVTGQGKLEPRSEGVALHRRDGRLGHGGKVPERPLGHAYERGDGRRAGAGQLPEGRDVDARGE